MNTVYWVLVAFGIVVLEARLRARNVRYLPILPAIVLGAVLSRSLMWCCNGTMRSRTGDGVRSLSFGRIRSASSAARSAWCWASSSAQS